MKVYLQKLNDYFEPQSISKEQFDELKPGFYTAEIKKVRNYQFHKKYFSLVNFAFEHWSTEFKNFDQFRKDLTILAGYFENVTDLRTGKVKQVAKSIAFDKMDEIEFERLYSKTIDVILQYVLPDYTGEDLEEVIMGVVRFG